MTTEDDSPFPLKDAHLADGTPDDLDPVPQVAELIEVMPEVVAVFGALPAELEEVLEPLNSGLLSVFDRGHIEKAVSLAGVSATVGGNLAQAAASMQGLYRMTEESQALLRSGGQLAGKDGAKLGTILMPKGSAKSLAQARFTPAAGLTAGQVATALGPALAMVALQAQLNQVGSLVQQNIDLTHQAIASAQRADQATLTSLVNTIEVALEDVRAAGSVPKSLWHTVASKKADLDSERIKRRANVEEHVRRISAADSRQRRDYLQSNAKAVVFDAFALLSTVRAWTGYQAIAAAVASEAGRDDAAEARHFESIVANTRRDYAHDVAETTRLVAALTRELRIIVELPGTGTLQLPPRRKDAEATRRISAGILEAIAPLSDALRTPREPLGKPEVLHLASDSRIDDYLRVLRWALEPDEELLALALGEDARDSGRVVAAVSAAKDKIANRLDKDAGHLMVVVTDQRILTTNTRRFMKVAEFESSTPVEAVRYVRSTPFAGDPSTHRIDLIARDRDRGWLFETSDVDHSVDALAAVLAESMTLPADEKKELTQRRSISGSTNGQTQGQDADSTPVSPAVEG